MTEKIEIIIIDKGEFKDRVGASLISCALLLGCVGVGVAVGSAALQWIGGLVWVFWFIGEGRRMLGENQRKTIQEARAHLDRLEAAE